MYRSFTSSVLYGIFVLGALLVLFDNHAEAGPFVTQGPFRAPSPGGVIPEPPNVPGKEYSNRTDRQGHPSQGTPDPGQVVAWDGAGGTTDTTDFLGRFIFMPPDPFEVDALANSQDVLFDAVTNNAAALLFSTANDPQIYFESISGASGIWATASQIDQVSPSDVDGLEVWGPDINRPIAFPPFELETSFNDAVGGGANSEQGNSPRDDANRYSLLGDPAGVSVYDSNGFPAVSTFVIAAAIGRLDLANAIDVDAMMINGGSIMFSIAPVDVFDGGEIWVWDGAAPATFLNHGGHLWNTLFPVMDTFGTATENVNALESVAPVPSNFASALLLLATTGVLGYVRSRRKGQTA